MKRIVTVVAAIGLIAGACGGGDDDAGSDATEDQAAAASETSADSTDTDSTAEADTNAAAADENAADDDGAAAGDDDGGDDDGGGTGRTIRSISDIPGECRDRMADFLREIEPIVSSINWQTATFDEFEAIAEEFEAKSDVYEEQFTESGCDDLDFEGDSEFTLMIEFAQDEAPGTVSFLQFLADLGAGSGDDGDATGDATVGPEGFANCDEAISFVQDLVDNYDSFGQVPASELVKFSSLATIFITCTPEQLEFFDSEEVTSFLDG